MRSRHLPAAAAVLATAAVLALTGTPPAGAVDVSTAPVSAVTTVGVHNTYVTSTYAYLAQALDARPGLVELDVWDDIITREWKVSHSNPLGNDNNCVAASGAAGLYSGSRNKNLEYCLDDVRLWLGAHPDAAPLILKLELKAGFSSRTKLGPAELDTALRTHLGSAVFRPADLLQGTYATPDAAARAGAWPTRQALGGRVIVEIIPGTVEEANPTDTLWTDVEYAGYLRGLAAAGTLGQAQAFPAVHRAQTGDPRTRYPDTGLRPWFVVFDGDAATYVPSIGATSGIDTSWYDTSHYLLVMTDAQNVSPAVSGTDEAAVRQRVADLAARHASVVSSDWSALPAVLPLALPRGH